MAEFGRARPVIVASIATLLTANIAILSANRVDAERTDAPDLAQVALPAPGFVVFGKSDTRVGLPTAFAVRADGVGLTPWSHPIASDAGRRSHAGTRAVAVYAGNLWVLQRGARPRQLTHFAPLDATFCGGSMQATPDIRNPIWSPDDTRVAFLSNAHHLRTFGTTYDVLVVDVARAQVRTAYRAAGAVCDRGVHAVEFLTLFGWAKSANMAA